MMDEKDSSSNKPGKRFPCPFKLSSLHHFSLIDGEEDENEDSYRQFFEKINDQGPEDIHLDEPSMEELTQHLDTLEKLAEEQKQILNERAELLRAFLKNQFNINDVDAWLAEQQEKTKETKPITLTM